MIFYIYSLHALSTFLLLFVICCYKRINILLPHNLDTIFYLNSKCSLISKKSWLLGHQRLELQGLISLAAGSIKTNIKPSRNQCSGKVEVYYEGQWLPVSQESLQSPATQNIICRELKCGQALKIISFAGLQPGARVISDIQCPQTGSGVFEDCNSRVADPGKQISALGGLRCSGMFHISG